MAKDLHGIFLDAVGRLYLSTTRATEGIEALRQAVALSEQADGSLVERSATLHYLACGLADNGRWPEAEPVFRECLRLAEDAGDTPASRASSLIAFATRLTDNNRWNEAEPMYREALRLLGDLKSCRNERSS